MYSQRLLNESVLQIWKARKAAVREELAIAERAAKTIHYDVFSNTESPSTEKALSIETGNEKGGGRYRTRTCDLVRVKHAL